MGVPRVRIRSTDDGSLSLPRLQIANRLIEANEPRAASSVDRVGRAVDVKEAEGEC